MEMVEVTLGWIKYWFPEFEFTWLAVSLISVVAEHYLYKIYLGRNADEFAQRNEFYTRS